MSNYYTTIDGQKRVYRYRRRHALKSIAKPEVFPEMARLSRLVGVTNAADHYRLSPCDIHRARKLFPANLPATL
jgi:hypothetical protein